MSLTMMESEEAKILRLIEKTVQDALALYPPTYWASLTRNSKVLRNQKEKQASYHNMCQLGKKITQVETIASEELFFLRQVLSHFIQLPLPLYGSLNIVKERRIQQELALQILETLPSPSQTG